MKTVSTILRNTLVASCLIAASASISANELALTLNNITKHEGKIMVALFDSEANYNGEGKAAAVAMIPVTNGKVSYTFSNIENGSYAIKLYHDENNNQKMDFNDYGIPTEGYGFSNNVGAFGIPSFEEAKFEVLEQTDIQITVRKVG